VCVCVGGGGQTPGAREGEWDVGRETAHYHCSVGPLCRGHSEIEKVNAHRACSPRGNAIHAGVREPHWAIDGASVIVDGCNRLADANGCAESRTSGDRGSGAH
jgi:hypothetical protein